MTKVVQDGWEIQKQVKSGTLNRDFRCAGRGAASVQLRAYAEALLVLIRDLVLKLVSRGWFDEVHRAAAEPAPGHASCVHAFHGDGRIDQEIELLAAHFIIE